MALFIYPSKPPMLSQDEFANNKVYFVSKANSKTSRQVGLHNFKLNLTSLKKTFLIPETYPRFYSNRLLHQTVNH